MLIAPPSGPLMVSNIRTHPFGSKRAPANWARVTRFAQWPLMRVCEVFLPIYVDDCFGLDPVASIASAYTCVCVVNELLGLRLGPFKSQRPTTALTILGAALTLGAHSIAASLPERKRSELIKFAKEVLARGTLTPAESAMLRVRLGFAQSLLFFRVGRTSLQSFTDRQYCRRNRRAYPLDRPLREALNWWACALAHARPRRVNLRIAHPVLVYSDACGVGHIAAVVVIGGAHRTFQTHLPPWFVDMKVGISEFELAAVLLGLLIAAGWAPGSPIFFCCDNTGVDAAVVRGSCSTDVGRALTACFWSAAACAGPNVWIEYVESASNVADSPSRMCPCLGGDMVRLNAATNGAPASFRTIMNDSISLRLCANHSHSGDRGLLGAYAFPECPNAAFAVLGR